MPGIKVDSGEDASSEEDEDQDTGNDNAPNTQTGGAEGDPDGGGLDQALETNDVDTPNSQYLNVDGKNVSSLSIARRRAIS